MVRPRLTHPRGSAPVSTTLWGRTVQWVDVEVPSQFLCYDLLRGRNKTYLSEMSSSHNGNTSPFTMLESEKCENPYDVLILRSWHAFSPLRNETMPCKAGRSVTCSVVSNSFRSRGLLVCQAPLSVEFSRQEYWGGLPSPSPEDLPDPGIKSMLPVLAGFFHH